MRLFKTFLIVTLFTVFLTVVQLFGYWVLESLIIMLMISFFTLVASVYLSTKNTTNNSSIDIEKDLKPRLEKIDNIERAVTDMFGQVSNKNLEEKLSKHTEDITYMLDKLAKKTMDLETRITNFGNGLANSMENLKTRVKDMEAKKEGESFSIGELVYVEDEKEDT